MIALNQIWFAQICSQSPELSIDINFSRYQICDQALMIAHCLELRIQNQHIHVTQISRLVALMFMLIASAVQTR